jgi:NAD(P)-dependent dehydrogenase (short-subunit alcohol dehydrogenase family)
VERVVGAAVEAHGRLDVLVNAAGIVSRGAALDLTPGDWGRVLDVNLGGTFFACQAAARAMVSRGAGAIVNVASELALVADGNHAGYIASKAGVVGLTRALAVEWGPLGIRVNAVAPGLTRTPMTADLAEADREDYRTRTPDRRLAEPDDIAEAVLFLVSDASRHVAGQLLVVDGGYTIT